ncbi:YeaC family protein [Pseudoalteromonas fenneropenaei]|uniref:YeaC family protein n=1 Tax=Pseudoalteromonas fenneropenaei TaxID=1737459 RepID=A0ABV7CF09_9GAMM
MNIDNLVRTITPEIYERLQYGAATGKWPDGTPLSEAQKEQTMQLVMLYQAKVAQTNEQFTIGANGEMVQKSKRELQQEFTQENEIARFSEHDL